MFVVAGVCIVIAIASVVFAARCYRELQKWSSECNSAQIAIAYKRKVKIVAPLTEWMLWTRQLSGEEANGRTIYHVGGTSVAIIKKRGRSRNKPPKNPAVAPKSSSSQLSYVTNGEDKANAKQDV